MRKFVGDNVETAGERVKTLSVDRKPYWKPVAIDHYPITEVERVCQVIEDHIPIHKEVVEGGGVNDIGDRKIAIVETKPPESLKQVVVCPAGVDVSIDHSRVGPPIVAIGRVVRRKKRSEAIQVTVDRQNVSPHVEGVEHGRPQGVSRDKRAALLRGTYLFFATEHARSRPNALAFGIVPLL